MLLVSAYCKHIFFLQTGFAVQAYDESGKMILGKFKPDPKHKFLGCNGKPMTLAYEGDTKPKTLVHLKWDVPADFQMGQKVLLKASVAKDMKERYMLSHTLIIKN